MDTPQPPLKIAVFFLNTNQKDPKGHPVKSKVSNPRDHILWYIHHFWPFGKMWSLLMPISPFDTAQCRGHLGHYGPCLKEPSSLVVDVDIIFFNYIDLHPFLLLNQPSPSKILTTLPTIQFGLQEERLFHSFQARRTRFILKVLIQTWYFLDLSTRFTTPCC